MKTILSLLAFCGCATAQGLSYQPLIPFVSTQAGLASISGPVTNMIVLVINSAFCTSTAGSGPILCHYNGATWDLVGGGGGASIAASAYPAPSTCTAGSLSIINSGLFSHALCTATNTETYYYSGYAITPAALLTGFNSSNMQGSNVETHANGYSTISALPSSGGTLSWAYWTAPATPYTKYIHLRVPYIWNNVTTDGNARSWAIGFQDGNGTKQKYLFCGTSSATISTNWWCDVRHGVSGGFTANDITAASGLPGIPSQGEVIAMLKDDGTNITIALSGDGSSFYQVFQEARTTYFAAGPTQMVFAAVNNGTTSTVPVTLVGMH